MADKTPEQVQIEEYDHLLAKVKTAILQRLDIEDPNLLDQFSITRREYPFGINYSFKYGEGGEIEIEGGWDFTSEKLRVIRIQFFHSDKEGELEQLSYNYYFVNINFLDEPEEYPSLSLGLERLHHRKAYSFDIMWFKDNKPIVSGDVTSLKEENIFSEDLDRLVRSSENMSPDKYKDFESFLIRKSKGVLEDLGLLKQAS